MGSGLVEEPVTVIDGGVPAVYPAAEYAHVPEQLTDAYGISVHICMTCRRELWPCKAINAYMEGVKNLANESTKESTGGEAQGAVLRGK